ncbi:MAG: DUF455 family protein [Planctomycetes bacterium]|nr:DUF455 family protein [Planctomycetota bacterium]
MELRELAEVVLRGGTLADKLLAPCDALTDDAPGQAETVAEPAREGALRWRVAEERELPPQAALSDPRQRAALLHAFANHELLAVELFALMLLRFPDAPAAFRRGLAQTLQDEQRHLGLYVARLEQLGVPFGSLPLSRYLWDAMAEVTDPLDFVTRMALTFEQANLDHMRSTAARLREVGDAESAAILERIGREEVQHVALGLRWFERWRPEAEGDTWSAYCALLAPPLTPRRARGDAVWESPRLEAGLSPSFVRELKVYSSTRGRPSRVLWFNPDCELSWSGAEPPRAVATLARDLAGIPALLADADDVVLAPRPGVAHLEALQRAGFALPEFSPEAPRRLLGEAAPWGWTRAAAARAASWRLQVAPPAVEGWGPLFSKAWAAETFHALPETEGLNARPVDLPQVCSDWGALEAALAATPGRAVAKAPYGASGRNQLRSDGPPCERAFTGWAEGVLRRQGQLVVQPWVEGLADVSCLVRIDEAEAGPQVRVLGCSRFRTDRRGQYLGHDVGALDDGLDPELRRALHGAPQALLRAFVRLGQAVGARLAAAGFRGPAGIDAVLARLPQGLALVPLEVNPRSTFGHVALALAPRLVPGRGGAFALLPLARARALLATPPRCAQRGATARLEHGALALTDPASAERCVAVLVAAATPSEAWRWLAGDRDAPTAATMT